LTPVPNVGNVTHHREDDHFSRIEVDRYKSVLYESPIIAYINRNIFIHSGVFKRLAFFSKQAVQKTSRYTWKMMSRHLFNKMWFGEKDGSAENRGFLYYSLPNHVGLPGHTERKNCKSLNSVLDILDVG
jgi:hypothetical protein